MLLKGGMCMWYENVIFFPFQSYHSLKSIPLKDKKDHYFFNEFKNCFYQHKALSYIPEYIEEADELHYINILVGSGLAEMVTFVSQTFREVFKESEQNDMGVEIIEFQQWLEQPFTRSFVELPIEVLTVFLVPEYLERFRAHVFPDWCEGFEGPLALQISEGLAENSDPVYISLEKVVVLEYTKEMLREVLENPIYDLKEMNNHELSFTTSAEGVRQWEKKFPKS